jgi:hypothetical protein
VQIILLSITKKKVAPQGFLVRVVNDEGDEIDRNGFLNENAIRTCAVYCQQTQ